MECPECFNHWSSDLCIPRLLKCGHSLCQDCVPVLMQQNSVQCPSCHDVTPFSVSRRSEESSSEFTRRCVESMTKNFTLLSLISTRPSLAIDKSKAMRDFKLGMQCPEHQRPIHSFTERPFSLLCDECLVEISELGLKVQPFGEAVKHCQENLGRALEQVRTKLQRLHNTRLQLESMAGAENSSQLQSLASHLRCFKERLDREQRESLDNLARLHASLSHIQSKSDQEIRNQESVILSYDQRARQLASLDEFSLVMRHLEVSQLLEQSRKQLAVIDIPEDSLKITFTQLPYDTLKLLINNSVQLTLETELIDSWKCRDCSTDVPDGTIMCSGCRGFRPLSSYPSLLLDPMNATPGEIQEIQSRRELELAMISSLDNSSEAEQTAWYIINADWVSEWKCFIFNKPSHVREQNSINQEIGVLPPGPISNHKLFRDPLSPLDLRPKLKPVAHYRGVNEKVWQTYVKLYGGGPMICRKRLDIYEEPGLTPDRATV
mmetsp:Transcript_12358/g.23433  ORF Transcript_12358/g.23433 Transcript_12358/m.23433 type:complete len:491 (-) Transcript_12358:61-1533(-)